METTLKQIEQAIATYTDTTPAGKEYFYRRFLHRTKSDFVPLFATLATLPPPQRKQRGEELNQLKAQARIQWEKWQATDTPPAPLSPDPTRPPQPHRRGTHHPLTTITSEVVAILERVGFGLTSGSVIEQDWYNFEGLGFPPYHPARQMQDTFFLDTEKQNLLRTHTTSVQLRTLQEGTLPLRKITTGTSFRNEAISSRTHCAFHQLDAFYVDEGVSFAQLKSLLIYFVRQFFGSQVRLRLRPSYFPFTEPSAEVDISCTLCGGEGCRICKKTGWLEIGGCGMIDPQVLANAEVDTHRYTGYAFGLGIDRLAMLRYQIQDIRYFFTNDATFLSQFTQGLASRHLR